MPRFYGTFGFSHPLDRHYIVVEAPTEDMARAVMFDKFKAGWAFIYNAEEFEGQAKEYGLTQVGEPLFGEPGNVKDT